MVRPRKRSVTAKTRCICFALLVGLAGCADLPRWMGGPDSEAAGTMPDSAYNLGKMDLAAGRAGLAVRHFRDAVDQAPGSLDALNGLAAAYDSLGRHDLAARSYARALALEPDSAETLNNIGYSYLRQGRFDLAVAFLRDANRRDADAPIILENRRVAEIALANVGGPAPRYPISTTAIGPEKLSRSPYPRLVRSGRAVQTLITRPHLSAAPPRPIRSMDRQAAVLPRYMRAPLTGKLGIGRTPLLPDYVASPIDAAGPRRSDRRRS
jgi:tetratricopeptide (TPR) repeat protein